MLTKTLKQKIRNAVDLYILSFNSEYIVFKVQLEEYRKNLKNDYATAVSDDGREHALEREMYQMPEKLYYLILKNLSDEELTSMDTKEFARWFVEAFPDFKVTKNA